MRLALTAIKIVLPVALSMPEFLVDGAAQLGQTYRRRSDQRESRSSKGPGSTRWTMPFRKRIDATATTESVSATASIMTTAKATPALGHTARNGEGHHEEGQRTGDEPRLEADGEPLAFLVAVRFPA